MALAWESRRISAHILIGTPPFPVLVLQRDFGTLRKALLGESACSSSTGCANHTPVPLPTADCRPFALDDDWIKINYSFYFLKSCGSLKLNLFFSIIFKMMETMSDNDDFDAAAALFNRGDFLRKLREMERQDDEERAREQGSMDLDTDPGANSTTLDYQNYLANQSYYDDYKHVNYHHIDFGIVGDRPLIVQQDRSVGKGGLIWDAGYILADHLIQTQELWNPTRRPVRMVELGSGTGVTGLMLACAFPESQVHLTDLAQLMPLLNTNAKGMDNATVGELEWGTTATLDKYDVIVGSDVVASIYDSSALAKTIYDLVNKRSQVYLACRDRLAGSIEQFEGHLSRLFDVVERRKATSYNKNPDVWILHVAGRKSSQ